MEEKKYILATDNKCEEKIFQSDNKNEIFFYASVYNEDYPNKTLFLFNEGNLIQTFNISDKDL